MYQKVDVHSLIQLSDRAHVGCGGGSNIEMYDALGSIRVAYLFWLVLP